LEDSRDSPVRRGRQASEHALVRREGEAPEPAVVRRGRQAPGHALARWGKGAPELALAPRGPGLGEGHNGAQKPESCGSPERGTPGCRARRPESAYARRSDVSSTKGVNWDYSALFRH